MSYTKQNFIDGQILTAAHLNHMEAGIENAAVGIQGPKGDKGDKGDPGPAGAQGAIGATGAQGPKGDKGDPGAKGDKGDPGAKGDKGDTGATGLQGPVGAVGLKGDKGDPGTKGDKGDKGDPGEGFTSTAKELLLSLFENAAYKTGDAQDTLNALRVEWGGSVQDIPVQSVSLSSSTLTLSEGESKTLTATVLPANATGRVVVWSVSPAGFATVVNGKVTGDKAGTCTVTATAGGKSASCAVTVAAVETAELIYDMTDEIALSTGFDTGLKLLEHAATETPQYTILLDLKPSDNYEATTSTQVLYCMTKIDQSTWKTAGINLFFNPNNGTLPFIYYSRTGLSLCDTIEHFKMRTRYVIQTDGKNFRGGSTHRALGDWNTTSSSLTNVPESMIIGGAREAISGSIVRCLEGTLYQCKVYKGLLSDAKVKAFIKEGAV